MGKQRDWRGNQWGAGSDEFEKWQPKNNKFVKQYLKDADRFAAKAPEEGNEEEVDMDNWAANSIEAGKIRILFYGGAKKRSDNNAFYFAAKNVNKTYGNSGKMFFAKSAAYILDTIKSQSDSSISSIDFFTHGSQYAFYMSSETSIDQDNFDGVNVSLYASNTAEAILEWGLGDDTRVINDIDYNKFTYDAIIEIHGCNSGAETTGWDNIADNLSQYLEEAGKGRAVVIGHTTKANPNINGNSTKISEQDYRHGSRKGYNSGEVLFKTTKSGSIPKSIINEFLNKKDAQSNYDGTKERY